MNNHVSAPDSNSDVALVTPAQADFAEKMGLLVESDGWMPRMSGRVFGTLLVANAPISQSALRDTLQASLGAISGATRDLISRRLAQRVSITGSRRAGLELHPDAWQMLEERGLRIVQDYQKLASDGLLGLNETNTPASNNLERMRDYFTIVEERMAHVIELLEAAKQHQDTGR